MSTTSYDATKYPKTYLPLPPCNLSRKTQDLILVYLEQSKKNTLLLKQPAKTTKGHFAHQIQKKGYWQNSEFANLKVLKNLTNKHIKLF